MSQTPETPDNANAADNLDAAPEISVDAAAPSLEQQLAEAQAKQAEHYDAWMRAKAETENMRRRAQEDISKAAKFAIERFANELLPVKDGLEQTLAVENASLETLRDGVDMTLRNLARAFEKSVLLEINPVGEKFDPHQHQAISAVPSTEPANTVVQVFQKGYSLEGRVLRPALVAVAQAAT